MNHNTNGRRLKALVIHDTAFPPDSRAVLGTSEVELCTIRIGEHEQVKIGTWEDVLQILQGISDVAPESLDVKIDDPDLIFIDCHFSDDRQAPSIAPKQEVSNRVPKIGRHIDPRGLLYGAVVASFYMGRQPGRALGFAVYSQDMEAAADNGYAQTFFSLLEALAGRVDTLPHPDDFKDKMAAAPKTQFPDLVLDEALTMYRISLLRSFRDRFYPDVDSLESAYRHVSQLLESDGTEDIPADLAISWRTSSGQQDTVLLRSLLADCINGATEGWDIGKIEDAGVVKFISDAMEESNPRSRYLKPVQQVLENRDTGKSFTWPEEGVIGYKHKTLALFIEWAMDRTRAIHYERAGLSYSKASIEQLNDRLGLDSTPINRALGRTLGNSDANRDPALEPRYTGSALLTNLDGGGPWRYNQVPWLRNMVQEHLRSLAMKDSRYAEVNWPHCLKVGRIEDD